MGDELLLCYNRGCGKQFNPNNNPDDACIHHPGQPIFHDAYKGWSCCNRKCTDFTEFLNMKGCIKSKHSNLKPSEPEKIDKPKSDEVIEYKPPLPKQMDRPSFETPLVKLEPVITAALKAQTELFVKNKTDTVESDVITVGTPCQNNSCKSQYNGPDSNIEECLHHPGVPIFHEGLKFWSCCQKRTTDFDVFLEQVGCTIGRHQWTKKKTDENISCRYDWHQTGSRIEMSIYAKKYDPYLSTIELNPIRLKIHLFFPEDDKSFDLDLELRGVVKVEESECLMTPTKVEIKLKKAEPGSWSNLDFPKMVQEKVVHMVQKKQEDLEQQMEDVDLSDIY